MNIGALDRLITIYENTKTRTDSGDVSYSRSQVTQLWAQLIETSSGNFEKSEQGRRTATHTQKFKTRYSSSVQLAHEILFDGNYYDIISIQKLGRDAMYLTAESKTL